MYGPKGVGALYVRRKPRVRLTAQMDGGGHERGMRSGTLNVPASSASARRRDRRRRDGRRGARLAAARPALRAALRRLDRAYVNGDPSTACPATSTSRSRSSRASADDGASRTWRCRRARRARQREPRALYVLRALGVGDELAHTSIRFGLGRFTTEEEVDFVIELVTKVKRCATCRRSTRWQEGIDLKVDPMGRALTFAAPRTTRRDTMAYSDKVIDHYENPATSARSTRTTRTSAPASSARPPAAT
jgi:cysteine sulfinate desulfinase/cysteine desulfurase-like protein